jgi:mannose/fructose/N-acetylgalactosamine-specific phosphotransferase system component IIC
MSFDSRKHFTQTNRRLVVGFLIILFLIGDGLIYLLYGAYPALMGLLCLGAGLIPLLGIGLIFRLLERVSRSRDP